MKKKMDRREFLVASSEMMTALGALTAGIQVMPKLANAATSCDLQSSTSDIPHKKYLISMECGGGIDNHYLANPLDPSQFDGYADRYRRFSEAAGRSITHLEHPLAPGHFIGPGLLPDNYNGLQVSDLLRDFFFVKGLEKEGEHDLGNRIIANGGSSVYNAGFCSLMADYCSKFKEKPFQHVVLGSKDRCWNQVGMLKGAAVPMVLSDMNTFQSSVRDLASDPAALDRKQFVRQMVKELYSDIAEKTLAKCESRRMFLDFGKFFDQMIQIRERPILYSDSNVDWNDIWNWWQGYMNHQANNHPMCQLEMYDQNGFPQKGRYFRQVFGPFAFYGALTEFLIRRDLTSVVNFNYMSGDRHTSNKASPGGYTAEGQIQAAAGSLFVGLMHRLKRVPAGNGKTLLDQTVMLATSEFDRTSYDDGGGGSDHAGYHTILMAGANNRGVVGGQVSKGGPLAGYRGRGGSQNQYDVLTWNKDGTPNRDGNGLHMTVASVLPMVLKMTGAALPAQQITQASQSVDQLSWIKQIA